MDTSEQYIKMCDCEEIQSGRNAYPYNREEDDFYRYYPNARFADSKSTIFLPRQDQLQEMVKDRYYGQSPWSLLSVFFHWSLEVYTHDFGETSMEQLWLAFVMKEKFSKTWNGTEWIFT